MIVTVRYRDIPWEEASRCLNLAVPSPPGVVKWEVLRGQPVDIDGPWTGPIHASVVCGGPFFKVVGGIPDQMVCPHCAEIED